MLASEIKKKQELENQFFDYVQSQGTKMFETINLKLDEKDKGIGHKTLKTSPSEKRQMWQ